ncbi:MAG: DNA topoisomerase 4 subunit A [Lachnospiraceae bacterium]|jgi:DNA gyrase subunit A|nr:DNA topoisomerase 4 subunit A [Lachnospiraceae bacterium]
MSEKTEENIIRTEYSELMQKSYIDYAMSVIIARALPDVRDGLKPVQRRTLYDMLELGTYYDRPYRKSARIVGDTMGKFHPHGDSSIYDALVVMAQDFKKKVPLVDGHGNFGSIEGDGAAAMRYTEARLAKITQDVYLGDLDKNVVDFLPNFDETEKEPEVLPVRIPNLLVNGADGIAVGMATSIPPHNLSEVIEAEKAYIRNNQITTKQLMKYLSGPDFPTGGIVVNKSELEEIYETGTGKIRLRGRTEIEKGKNGKINLVITEIPYTMIGANIGKFLNDVASLVENRQAPEITDISNQSSKEGIRIVIELKRGSDAERVRNLLFKKTRLEDTFGVNMLAVAGGRPETLGLRQIFEYHVDFQFDLTTKKYQTLLDKELERKEIQEGLIRAVDVIDLIIEILRGSRDQKMVRVCLTRGETEGIRFRHRESAAQAKTLRFTERQATAILEMRLAKLIGLEIDALYKENAETLKKIEEYRRILNDYDAMAEVILRDLDHIKKEYGTPRKTKIEDAEAAAVEEAVEVNVPRVILIDRFGYVKSLDPSVYERNREAADSESRFIIRTSTDDRLVLFTDAGNFHTLRVKEIPFGKFRDKGTPADNLCNYESGSEGIVHVNAISRLKRQKLLFVTSAGMVKVVDGSEFDVTRRTAIATKLPDDGTRVIFVGDVEGYDALVLQSANGYFLKFPVSEVGEKKKTAVGDRGIQLSAGDHVEAAYLITKGKECAVPFGGGEVSLSKLKLSSRARKGTKH